MSVYFGMRCKYDGTRKRYSATKKCCECEAYNNAIRDGNRIEGTDNRTEGQKAVRAAELRLIYQGKI